MLKMKLILFVVISCLAFESGKGKFKVFCVAYNQREELIVINYYFSWMAVMWRPSWQVLMEIISPPECLNWLHWGLWKVSGSDQLVSHSPCQHIVMTVPSYDLFVNVWIFRWFSTQHPEKGPWGVGGDNWEPPSAQFHIKSKRPDTVSVSEGGLDVAYFTRGTWWIFTMSKRLYRREITWRHSNKKKAKKRIKWNYNCRRHIVSLTNMYSGPGHWMISLSFPAYWHYYK